MSLKIGLKIIKAGDNNFRYEGQASVYKFPCLGRSKSFKFCKNRYSPDFGNIENVLLYEGQFVNGKPHGYCRMYDFDSNEVLYYEGQFENGIKHRIANYISVDGNIRNDVQFEKGKPIN